MPFGLRYTYKVLEKGAPRWVSLSSAVGQLHHSRNMLSDEDALLVSFHDMVRESVKNVVVVVVRLVGRGESGQVRSHVRQRAPFDTAVTVLEAASAESIGDV